MFDHEMTLDVLCAMDRFSKKRRRKVMTSLLFDEEFIKWLFQPDPSPNLTEIAASMYKELTKGYVMDALADAVEFEGYREFDRSHATFLTTVSNLAITNNNELIAEVENRRKDGEITRKHSNHLMAQVDDENQIIAKLIKRARRIVKREAYDLARETRLPRYITIAALTSVPDPKYIDRFKIGYYLNNLLNTIYSDVERNGEFSSRVKWRTFFKVIFGKDNVVEAATFILLEGLHRIDKYRNSDDVRSCWDTLTTFALTELNDSPDQVRQQMIELYIKRIDKMFANKAYDLRVNLLHLDEGWFPKLAETVEKYADRIVAILDRKQ